MANKKSALFFTILLTLFVFVFPSSARAYDLQDLSTAGATFFTKVRESVEYLFAFKVEQKIAVLEKQAEKRLTTAQDYAKEGNNEKVQSTLQSYLQIKERQNDLLGKTDNDEALGMVEERTIEQQKTMEEIKTNINEDGKQNVVNVQEQVVNQVAQRIVEVNGPEGRTEFFNKVEHVWAPGTGPGGEAGTSFAPGTSGTSSSGVVIEGGLLQFAPGTSAGGPSGADIKTVEVKTSGGESGGTYVVEGGNQNFAPGTSAGGEGGGQNANPGTPDGSKTWIDP